MNEGQGSSDAISGDGSNRGLTIEILKLALPALVSLCVDPLMSAVDTAYIGRLGPDLGGSEVRRIISYEREESGGNRVVISIFMRVFIAEQEWFLPDCCHNYSIENPVFSERARGKCMGSSNAFDSRQTAGTSMKSQYVFARRFSVSPPHRP